MKVLERLNDPELGQRMLKLVREKAVRAADRLGRPAVLMEVCGTHTTAISRSGLRSLFQGLVELRSGPGCPVCVTAAGDIETMIGLSRIPGVTVATFGDMLRVPGRDSSLERERAAGARIKIVYSPADALELAKNNPAAEVVFLGVGFETTAPLVALSIKQARDTGLNNFTVYSVHKIMPPALRSLLDSGGINVDGLILPGHVCAVTGSESFRFIGEDYGIPAIVTGFTLVDIIDSVNALLNKILSADSATSNNYRWVVKQEGNGEARRVLEECFYTGAAAWRGLGIIKDSGLMIKEELSSYDARNKFGLAASICDEPPGCRCGELLRGLIVPTDCGLFGCRCTPTLPVGPCMVSSEGACAAYYRYERGEVAK
ncbi:Hydrogenase maturation protein HypD [Desulfotomaculum arcticum]|uniref:Hydrogenase maturation protein HypD n=1 Tax=Desulfotruncus arcticus DSM 17038 TaxID=1121424 RepID=A0A1I2TW95_9FIRM|nr:Hydrogenase maturation protein HypD [Desulfotomaculum arcticum] [Desulfotruncus arcticus DSM 17038]